MGCRCASILDCKNDINTTLSIQDQLRKLQSITDSVSDACTQIASKADYCLLPPSFSMSVNIKKMNDPMVFLEMIAACEAHISRLNSYLTFMINEDYLFHNPSREG